MRWALSWALWAVGHGIYVVFDQWLPFGMRGWVYGAYDGAMGLSSRAQGEGRGPWRSPSPSPPVLHPSTIARTAMD